MIDEDILLENNVDKTRAVVRFSHIGDIILLSGVLLWRFREFDERFILFTSSNMADLFKYNPAILAVEEFEKSDLRGIGLISISRMLADEFPYLLYDMHGTLRTSILRMFWKTASFCYNKNAFARRLFLLSALLPERIRLKSLDLHVVERYAYNFSSSIPSAYELKPHLFLDSAEEEFAKAFYKKRNPDKRKVVLLHPFATLKGKLWTENNWQELYIKLCEDDYFPLFIGKRDQEKDKADSFSFISPVHTAIDVLSLRQSAALMAQANCVITGDSAPLHLANSVNTPVIALFGATAKEWGFFPLGKSDILLETKKHCRPCSLHGKKKNCPYNYACINDIKADDVLEALTVVENLETIRKSQAYENTKESGQEPIFSAD